MNFFSNIIKLPIKFFLYYKQKDLKTIIKSHNQSSTSLKQKTSQYNWIPYNYYPKLFPSNILNYTYNLNIFSFLILAVQLPTKQIFKYSKTLTNPKPVNLVYLKFLNIAMLFSNGRAFLRP